MATLSDIIGKVAALVDQADHWLSSAPTVTLGNLAIRGLENRLRALGLTTVMIEETEKTVTTTMAALTSASTPALPTDMEAPYQVWEKPAADATGYKECRFIAGMIPDSTPAAASIGLMYAWKNGELRFQAVNTASCKLKILYWKKATTLTLPSDTMPHARFEDALVYMIAALAARTRGMKALADEYDAKADASIKDLAMQEALSAKAKPKEFGSN